ncbi:recombinase family protein [Dapis sp. BLCC M229]|uniref:recombinase family protein n=1 Tax=Dapis sp. BLCC M229 TaxID=3400188 RepID=UPI003CED440B
MGAARASTICYCRVSSAKQRDYLTRQVEFMQNHYPEAEVIKDIASGLNFKRKGLRAILDRILQGDKLTIIVACRDRLTRFGFELIRATRWLTKTA